MKGLSYSPHRVNAADKKQDKCPGTKAYPYLHPQHHQDNYPCENNPYLK